jgi:hypothetical protein
MALRSPVHATEKMKSLEDWVLRIVIV